jgi:hypothetical protein
VYILICNQTFFKKSNAKKQKVILKLILLQQSKVVGDEIQFAFVKQAFMTSSILVNGKDGELEV